jgi:mono/diheme cytochrome c family protein
MQRTALLLALTLLPFALPATAQPFAQGKAKLGEQLHQEQCDACHAARFGGNGSRIYTRADRRVKNASSLAQFITSCNANLGNKLFPDDEANLGAYLNNAYYKFK